MIAAFANLYLLRILMIFHEKKTKQVEKFINKRSEEILPQKSCDRTPYFSLPTHVAVEFRKSCPEELGTCCKNIKKLCNWNFFR